MARWEFARILEVKHLTLLFILIIIVINGALGEVTIQRMGNSSAKEQAEALSKLKDKFQELETLSELIDKMTLVQQNVENEDGKDNMSKIIAELKSIKTDIEKT